MFRKQKTEPACETPIELAVSQIGNKWKLLILEKLMSRDFPWNLSELRDQIKGIDQTVLKVSLQSMEKDGLVKSKVYRDLPPRIEFTLGESGESLRPIIEAIEEWGKARMKGTADGH